MTVAAALRDTGERLIPEQVTADDVLTSTLLEHHYVRYRLAAELASGARVLDLACGTGHGSVMLAAAGAREVDGVDVAPEVIGYARARYQVPGVRYQVCAGEAWSAPPYDLVVSFDTLEHVRDPAAFLSHLRGLLHAGSTLFVSATVVPTRDIYAFHLHDFTPDSLRRRVVEAGLRIVSEHVQEGRFSARQVRYASRAHPTSLPMRQVARRPLHYLRRGWQAYVRDGLTYSSLALRCELAAPRTGG